MFYTTIHRATTEDYYIHCKAPCLDQECWINVWKGLRGWVTDRALLTDDWSPDHYPEVSELELVTITGHPISHWLEEDERAMQRKGFFKEEQDMNKHMENNEEEVSRLYLLTEFNLVEERAANIIRLQKFLEPFEECRQQIIDALSSLEYKCPFCAGPVEVYHHFITVPCCEILLNGRFHRHEEADEYASDYAENIVSSCREKECFFVCLEVDQRNEYKLDHGSIHGEELHADAWLFLQNIDFEVEED